MKAIFKLNGTDDVEAAITFTMPMSEWKLVRGALAKGNGLNWDHRTQQFVNVIDALIRKAENQIEQTEET